MINNDLDSHLAALVPPSLKAKLSPHTTLPGIPPQNTVTKEEVAEDVFRIAALGLFTPGEEAKTEKILDSKGGRAVLYHKDKNGLYLVTLTMPNGTTECWQQTDIVVNRNNGFKASAFERVNPDGTVYLGTDKKPKDLVLFPGNTNTNQDIATFNKIVKGEPVDFMFKESDAFLVQYAKNTLERAKNNHTELPNTTIGTHSIGTFSQGAGLKMKELGLNYPHHTVNIEPVGSAAALVARSHMEAMRYFNTTHPSAEQISIMGIILSQNIVSVRAQDTIFQAVGGQREHANAMVGETYRFESPTSGKAAVLFDHTLAAAANAMTKKGANGLEHRPWDNISSAKIINDMPLAFMEQLEANAKLSLFSIFAYEMRKGGHDATATDIHIDGITKSSPAAGAKSPPAKPVR